MVRKQLELPNVPITTPNAIQLDEFLGNQGALDHPDDRRGGGGGGGGGGAEGVVGRSGTVDTEGARSI